MDIYNKKSNWKLLLGIAGTIIMLLTLWYTNYLAKDIQGREEGYVKIYVSAQKEMASLKNLDQGADLELDIIQNFELPVILDRVDEPLEGGHFDEDMNSDQEFLKKKINEFLASGKVPVTGPGYDLYYFDSEIMELVKFFPWIMFFVLSIFVALGYYLFSSARKSEQNRVWAGMAKETAHQLGTPISAIMAWIEHLKEEAGSNEAQLEIIGELSNDVNRLELVADRFSKIGSAPVLTKVNVFQQIEKCMAYMKRRAPKRVEFNTYAESDKSEVAMMNQHLFDWVVENLLRNALDSMGGSGKISANVYHENEYICIDIEDSGKGIPSSKHKTVFQPGYSTKKRGWGLGLSLAKRIIENYHSGKIFVKNSKLDEGTTFSIKLPKV